MAPIFTLVWMASIYAMSCLVILMFVVDTDSMIN